MEVSGGEVGLGEVLEPFAWFAFAVCGDHVFGDRVRCGPRFPDGGRGIMDVDTWPVDGIEDPIAPLIKNIGGVGATDEPLQPFVPFGNLLDI